MFERILAGLFALCLLWWIIKQFRDIPKFINAHINKEPELPEEAFRPLSKCCKEPLWSKRLYKNQTAAFDDLVIYCSKCSTVMDSEGQITDKTLAQYLDNE